MSEDFEHLRQWVGRKEVRKDVASAWPLTALAATLDDTAVSTDAGAPIPPGWHWIFFLDAKPPAELGSDGHPKRGGFLPPVPLPRRMWAGGKLEFLRPLIHFGCAIISYRSSLVCYSRPLISFSSSCVSCCDPFIGGFLISLGLGIFCAC